MIWHPTIYNNFRHFLFITPPIFIFAGFTLEQLALRLKNTKVFLVVSFLLIVPGLLSMNKIHPFEYTYYNSFIGGTEGAHNNYELDYWGIAYKDAMDFVNDNLPAGSNILIWKEDLYGKNYANKHFFFTAHNSVAEEAYKNFDYLIFPTIHLKNHPILDQFPAIYSVDLENISLVKILENQ